MAGEESLGKLLHSRTVDETFRTTEDEEIIEKGREEAAAARTNDRTPDPVVVTKCEHCPWDKGVYVKRKAKIRSGIVRTLRSVPDHCGHDARSKVTRGVDSVACAWHTTSACYRGEVDGWAPVPRDVPVCIPNAAPIPRMTMKMTKGMRLGCNPLLRLSATENTTKTRMKVPMNWSGSRNI